MYYLCGNCGTVTREAVQCPCELGPECPITGGVCDHCAEIIRRNAIGRRLERV